MLDKEFIFLRNGLILFHEAELCMGAINVFFFPVCVTTSLTVVTKLRIMFLKMSPFYLSYEFSSHYPI